jgi:hypothetical protein
MSIARIVQGYSFKLGSRAPARLWQGTLGSAWPSEQFNGPVAAGAFFVCVGSVRVGFVECTISVTI